MIAKENDGGRQKKGDYVRRHRLLPSSNIAKPPSKQCTSVLFMCMSTIEHIIKVVSHSTCVQKFIDSLETHFSKQLF